MRHTLFIITAMALMALPIYAKRKSEGRVVSSLTTIWNNSTDINVAEIKYSADATTLTFQTTRDCGPKLKIGHGIYIVDDQGVRHHAISTKGIKLDSLYILPKGEKRRFSVSFEPVAESNLALDVIVPNSFAIFGLHDKATKLAIPEPECKRLPELSGTSVFMPQNVTIEGTFQDAAKYASTNVYANYYFFHVQSDNPHWVDKLAFVDENGHFKMTFPAYSPQEIVLMQRQTDGKVLGRIYVRPGDNIHLDLYDMEEGIENNISNTSGKEALAKVNNFNFLPGLPLEKYLNNYQNDFRFMSFEESIENLKNDYDKAIQYAKYICWHYKMNPYESQMYIERIKSEYIKRSNDALAWAQIIAMRDRNPVDEDTKKHYFAILADADMSFLKELEPEIYLTNNFFMTSVISNMLIYGPIYEIMNDVPETEENRWMKIITLQNEKLKQITGWEDWNPVMQGIILFGYRKIHKSGPMSEDEYRKMKELITHPFWAQELEGLHQRYS